MIKVERLVKQYGNTLAVDDISFEIGRGEVVGFLGPNGAGKTTTLRMLTGYLPASAGTVRINGRDVFRNSLEVRRQIGYLPEGVPLYPEMRVIEYLRHRAGIKGLRGKKRAERVAQVMEMLLIGDVQRKVIGTLSKGYRQRVGFADALVSDPPVLILDEPTIGLDPNQIRHVRQLIRDLGKERTVLLSTHILAEVEVTCARVLIIHHGRIVYEDAVNEIARRGCLGTKVVAEIQAPGDEAVRALREIPGVLDVQWNHAAPVGRFELTVRADADVRDEVFRRAVRNGWSLRELRRQCESLEDVFVRCTTADEASEN